MDEFKPVKKAEVKKTKEDIYCLCFSPAHPEIFCSAGRDRKLCFRNLENRCEKVKEFTGHTDYIWRSTFSYNGQLIASASPDNSARIWKVDSKDGDPIVLKDHKGSVWCVRFFHKDNSKLLTGSSDKTILYWDLEQQKAISKLEGCKNFVCSLDLLPQDNNTIVSSQKEITLWDLRAGKLVKELTQNSNWIYTVQFHPKSFSFVSGSHDLNVKIFDYRTYKLIQHYKEHTKPVQSVCYHPSGKYLLSSSNDNSFKIFDIEEKKVIYSMTEHKDIVFASSFSPSGNDFVTGGRDRKINHFSFPLGKFWTGGSGLMDNDEKERAEYLVDRILSISEDDDEEEDNVVFSDRNHLIPAKFGRESFFCLKSLFC